MWPTSPPWRDPLADSAPGAVFSDGEHLRARIVGAGRPIVFLHGLGASLRYWGRAYDSLAARHRLVFFDLLGFGGSPKPSGSYDTAQHCRALVAAFEHYGIARADVVAHSAGALLAIALATDAPSLVDNVIGFGTPLFPSQDAARAHLHALGPLARLMADDSRRAAQLCAFTCKHRELARRVAPIFAPRLPAPVAADGVDHVWASYKGTFDLVVRQPEIQQRINSLGARLTLIYGRNDRICTTSDVNAVLLGVPDVRLIRLPVGDHHLPLRYPARCRELVQTYVDGSEPSPPPFPTLE